MASKCLLLHNVISEGLLNEKITEIKKKCYLPAEKREAKPYICNFGLETGPLPMASGCIQDLGKVFFNMDLLLVNMKKYPVCIFGAVFKCQYIE